MNKIPVILDMDPGADDALGIILAVKSNILDIKGITICGGNVSRNQCAINAAKILKHCKATSIPIIKGAYRPLIKSPVVSSYVHGIDGLGNLSQYKEYDYDEDQILKDITASDFILDTIKKQDEKNKPLTIIATGPLTNIATAISKDRALFSKIKHLYWMGGAYTTSGNITPVAEFNAYVDPHAAKEVFDSNLPMTVVGLDVTMKVMLDRCKLDGYIKNNSETALFADKFLKSYFKYYHKYTGRNVCALHDPLAVAVCLKPELILSSNIYKIDMVTSGIAEGQTIIDRRPNYKWQNKEFLDYYEENSKNIKKFNVIENKPTVNVVLDISINETINYLCETIFN